MRDPYWYSELNPGTREIVDQALHIVLGFLITMFIGSYVSMVALFIREFCIQWPIKRTADTRMDMAFWMCGSGFAELAGMIG